MRCLINPTRVRKPLPFENLLVEIGFGRGDFITRLARENPDKVILGFELSGISIEKLLRRVKKERLENVFCVHMDAFWGFYFLLRDSSVERIFMNYPDPWFKRRHIKRRLTSKRNLYLFSLKMKPGGNINIRTDHYPFLEYTLEQIKELGGFSAYQRELSIEDPITKYEKKWLSMGKKIYELTLVKEGNASCQPLPKVKEVDQVFPVKLEAQRVRVENLENKEFKLSNDTVLKTFKAYRGSNGWLVEALLAEEGFVQKFFFEIREREKEVWILDISPFSQIIRTERLQKAVEKLAEIC